MKINKVDVYWGYFSLLLLHGVNLLLLPIILRYLNAAEIGLWYTFTSLYSLAMLIDFGFQSIISRNISYIFAGSNKIISSGLEVTDESSEINIKYFIKVLSCIKFIYLIMGIIVFTFTVTLGTFYVYRISVGELDIKISILSWIIYMFAIVLNITFSYWNAVLKGIGAIKNYNQSLVITKLIQLLFSVIFLELGYGIIGISIAYLLSVITNRLMQTYFFYKFSDVTKKTSNKLNFIIDKEILKALLPNTVKTGFLSLSNFLVVGFPVILCSYYLDLKTSGQFGFFNQIVTLILTISNSYFNTYLSKMNYLRAKNKNHELAKIFRKSIITNFIINFIAFALIISIGNFVLELISNNFKLPSSTIVIIVLFYRYMFNLQALFTSFISTKNEYPYFRAYLISSLIILVAQVLLLEVIENNIYFIIIPILIIQLVFNNWYWIFYVFKDIGGEKNVINE